MKKKYEEYNTFKNNLKQHVDFLHFILESNNSIDLSDKFPQGKEESEMFIQWIGKQFISNNNDISDIGMNHFSIIYDNDKRMAFILLKPKSNNSNILTNTPYNYVRSDGCYLIKDYFFLEYLFSNNINIVIANLGHTPAPRSPNSKLE